MSQEINKGEISLRDVILNIQVLFHYLWAKKTKILLSTIALALLFLLWSFIRVPVYRATTTFILESSKKGGSYAGIAAKLGMSVGMEAGGDVFRDDDNIMTLLRSRSIVADALYKEAEFNGTRQKLIRRFFDLGEYQKEWKKYPALANITFHKDIRERSILEDSVITYFHEEILKNTLTVAKPEKEQELILVRVASVDELFAKYFNEELIKSVDSYYVYIQTKRASENVNILKSQVDSVRRLLNEALTEAAISTDAMPNLNPAYQRGRVDFQKKLVDIEIYKASLVELVKNLEMAKITLLKETPLLQTIDYPILPLQKKELKPFKAIAIGAFLGCFFAVAFFGMKYFLLKVLGKKPDVD